MNNFTESVLLSQMNIRILSILALVLSLTGIIPAFEQQQKNLRFERYTIDQGISSDRISTLAQDNLGYIWAGTDAGVSRYDGYGFTVYRTIPGDTSSLSDNNVNVILADRFGTLWAGTRDGLNRYNRATDTFQRIHHDAGDPNSIPGDAIFSIYESASGELWFGTDNGLAKYDRKTESFISRWQTAGGAVSLEGLTVTSISEDKAGNLWIGTNRNGLFRFNPADKSLQPVTKDQTRGESFPSRNISKVLVDSSGKIWIGFLPDIIAKGVKLEDSPHGLGRYNPDTRQFTLYLYDSVKQPGIWNWISDILETSDHTIWVTSMHSKTGIEAGLHRFDPATGKFTRFTNDPYDPFSLSWSYGQTIFEDRDKNLWVGTSRGLNKADRSRWQMGLVMVNSKEPFSLLNNFYGIEEIDEDVIWFGLDGLGLIEWNRKAGTVRHNPVDSLKTDEIHVIRKDHDGMIWLGDAGEGLRRIDPKTKHLDRFMHQDDDSASICGNFISDILIGHDNTVWIATSNGLGRFNRTEGNFTNWRNHGDFNEMSGTSLSALYEDKKGNLWIGTKEHVYDPVVTLASGLMKFDVKTNRFQSYRHDPNDPGSLSNDAIYAIAEDRRGNIWIGTNNGLNRFDVKTEKFQVFLEVNGLPSPTIVGIIAGENGILWLSTQNGLSRFDPETNAFRNFTKADGLQANRFNEHSYFRTKSGELIFGGVAGANYFDPDGITGNQLKPELLITRFFKKDEEYRFAKPLEELGSLTLKWNDNFIGFEYLAINYRSTQLTRYEYRLEGFQKEWIEAGSRRYVSYTNLQPGTYKFRVRAENSDGILSKQDAVMVIRIKPPFWRTWWAYGFYLVLLAGGIFTVDRIQHRRVIQKERERSREKEVAQAKEIEQAYNDLKATQSQLIQSEKMASLGELTAGIAHEIQNPLNFVNNFSEVSNELIDEMKEEITKDNKADAFAIADDIKQNLEKILHHGRRADAIVKGMLQHSRSSSSLIEPADINALADEYLRLAYHGLRAKDKSFNSGMVTDYDATIGTVRIIPQDIGRVILNLITNAFYSVTEKKNQNPAGFEPTVTVTTRKTGDKVEITVKDNGSGIPQKVVDKIFQPFFTTKPAGQGTGLGLSLSYDIIKSHGGELKVKTAEGQGAEFSIILPV